MTVGQADYKMIKKIILSSAMLILFLINQVSADTELTAPCSAGDDETFIPCSFGDDELGIFFGSGAANNPPQITQVQSVSAITLSEFSTKTVDILFNVTDNDGYTDLNDSLAWCRLFKIGEPNRTSSGCTAQDQSGNDLVYNCSVGMYYYDASGTWNITCYAEDVGGFNDTNNTETATVNALNYVTQDLSALNWSSLNPGAEDGEAQSPLILTNGGNQDYTGFNITSKNATSGSDVIPNNKFMVDNESGQISGQTYLNDSGVDWNEGNLSRCTSPCLSNSTEESYFYVDTPTGILGGVYASIANWTISLS